MKDKLRVLYPTFVNTGGMAHYSEGLMQGGTESGAYRAYHLPCGQTSLYGEGGDIARLSVPYRYKGAARKLLEKYNSRWYQSIIERGYEWARPDVVHFTSRGAGILSAIKQCKRLGLPTVCTVHDPEPHDEFKTYRGHIYAFYQQHRQMRRALSLASFIHVHSEQHRATLSRVYGSEVFDKTAVVGHGMGLVSSITDTSQVVPPELEGVSRWDGDQLIIGYFGRIEPYKGLPILIEAYQRLRRHHGDNIQLILAGAGRDDSLYLVKDDPNVYVINRFIADSEVSSIFCHMDVVVLPYLDATQSGVIPLAYSHGKPVITSNVGALPEIVDRGRTGFIFERGNVDDLVNVIDRLISKSDVLGEMGRQAYSYAKQQSWPEKAKELSAVYHHAIEREKRCSA